MLSAEARVQAAQRVPDSPLRDLPVLVAATPIPRVGSRAMESSECPDSSNSTARAWEQRVVEIATLPLRVPTADPTITQSPILPIGYIKLVGRLRTFLQSNTLLILAENDGKPLDPDIQPLECVDGGDFPGLEILRLEHPLVQRPPLHFSPEDDFLWFSEVVTPEVMTGLNQNCGTQLEHIRNVIVEEHVWNIETINLLEGLQGVRFILVWLESYKFLLGARHTTEEGYKKRAAQFEERDRVAFQGRARIVVYADLHGNIYGGLGVTASESEEVHGIESLLSQSKYYRSTAAQKVNRQY